MSNDTCNPADNYEQTNCSQCNLSSQVLPLTLYRDLSYFRVATVIQSIVYMVYSINEFGPYSVKRYLQHYPRLCEVLYNYTRKVEVNQDVYQIEWMLCENKPEITLHIRPLMLTEYVILVIDLTHGINECIKCGQQYYNPYQVEYETRKDSKELVKLDESKEDVKNMKEYDILCANYLSDLRDKINVAHQAGWTPLGGISVTSVAIPVDQTYTEKIKYHKEITYYQLMERTKYKSD